MPCQQLYAHASLWKQLAAIHLSIHIFNEEIQVIKYEYEGSDSKGEFYFIYQQARCSFQRLILSEHVL